MIAALIKPEIDLFFFVSVHRVTERPLNPTNKSSLSGVCGFFLGGVVSNLIFINDFPTTDFYAHYSVGFFSSVFFFFFISFFFFIERAA